MSAITTKHFDILEYVKKAKEYGVSDQFAEYNARQIEHAIDIAVNTIREEVQYKELATKGDIRESELRLQKEIVTAKNQTILWLVGVLSAYGTFFMGIIAKALHWF